MSKPITHFSLVSDDYFTDKNSLQTALKKLIRQYDKKFIRDSNAFTNKVRAKITEACNQNKRCKTPPMSFEESDFSGNTSIRLSGIITLTLYQGKEVNDDTKL